ncbi:MAG TPA: hypothetical protein VEF89_24525 [Solirubrobacteraceae bacterium]|nr:hypothetical protein [Solirubrobacteraceae bacterium]
MVDVSTLPRIAPLEPPYEPAVEAMLEKWMPPGSAIEPLALFRTLAVHDGLMGRMRPLGAGILGHGRVEAREREIVIHRTCTLSAPLWSALADRYSEDQLELVIIVGWYRLLSGVINAVGIPREPWAARFPARERTARPAGWTV